MLPVLVLLAAILLMTLWGAGIYSLCLVVVTLLLCGGCAVLFFCRRKHRSNSLHAVPAVTASLVALAVIFLTLIPLPRRLDRLAGKRRHEQNQLAAAAIEQAVAVDSLEPGQRRPAFALTRNASGTRRILLQCIAMLCAAILGASLSGRSTDRFLKALVAFMALFAIAGFLHQWVFPLEKTLFWFIQTAHGRPVACFLSRTHYAGFIAMLCPAALVCLLSATRQRRWLSAALFGAAFCAMVLAIALSLSRGAVLAALAGLLTVLLVQWRSSWRRLAAVVLALLVLGAACWWLATNIPRERVRGEAARRLETLKNPLETTSAQLRISLWLDSLRVWQAYPLLGVGADGFQMVHPQFRFRTDRHAYNHVENQVLQVLVDGGILGSCVALWLLVAIGRQWKGNASAQVASRDVHLAVGGAAAVVVTHNLLDFPLYIPLYGILFAILVGMVTSPLRDGQPAPSSRSVAMLPAAAFLAVAIFIACFAIRRGTTALELDDPDTLQSLDTEGRAAALVAAPTAWHAWCALGLSVFETRTPGSMRLGESFVVQATRYDPNNYLLWEALGQTRTVLWDEAGAEAAYRRMRKLRDWKKLPPDRGALYY